MAWDPPCHLIVNMHLGTALAPLDGAKIFAFSSGITLSQGLFITGSIHEVVQVSRSLSVCLCGPKDGPGSGAVLVLLKPVTGQALALM